MDNKKLATTLEADLNNAVFALGRLTGTAIEAISRLKAASGTDETVEKEPERTLQKAIAVDFDGCLCANAYPEIGAPHWNIIAAAAAAQRGGAGIILWTCREGKLLQDALEACERWGLRFDAVNDSLPSWKEAFGNDSRKVGADEYWDDKAYRVENDTFWKGGRG
jgi:hypothetical protein